MGCDAECPARDSFAECADEVARITCIPIFSNAARWRLLTRSLNFRLARHRFTNEYSHVHRSRRRPQQGKALCRLPGRTSAGPRADKPALLREVERLDDDELGDLFLGEADAALVARRYARQYRRRWDAPSPDRN